MKKIFAAAALVICAALFLSACKGSGESIYSLSENVPFSIDNLDSIVETVRSALKGRSKSFTVSFTFKGDYMEDISFLVRELMDLAVEPTGQPDEGDYLKYQMGGFTFTYGQKPVLGGYRYTVTVTPEYYSTHEEELKAGQKAEEILDELSAFEDAGDAEKIRAAYDYLSEHVKYDAVHKNNDYHTLKSTAYGALVNGSAGCQGYAVSMYRLLMAMGVECHVITGQGISASGSEYHAWNIVRIGDKFYNIDPTWNDPEKRESYYLKGSLDFPDHIPDEEFDGLYDISEYAYEP